MLQMNREVGQVSHARIHCFEHFLFLFHHAADTGSLVKKNQDMCGITYAWILDIHEKYSKAKL